jgi:hypothetical protein
MNPSGRSLNHWAEPTATPRLIITPILINTLLEIHTSSSITIGFFKVSNVVLYVVDAVAAKHDEATALFLFLFYQLYSSTWSDPAMRSPTSNIPRMQICWRTNWLLLYFSAKTFCIKTLAKCINLEVLIKKNIHNFIYLINKRTSLFLNYRHRI